MIEEYTFGCFIIDGKRYLDDIKLIREKVEYWYDREKHTLKIKDIESLVKKRPEILIIGTGASGLLEISDDVKNFIRSKGIKLILEKTADACKTYNECLKQNKRVCAILHATC